MAVGWVQVIASLLRGELSFVPCFANSSAYDVESLVTVGQMKGSLFLLDILELVEMKATRAPS